LGSKEHKKDTFWLLSNVAANSEADSNAIVKSNLLSNLIQAAADP